MNAIILSVVAGLIALVVIVGRTVLHNKEQNKKLKLQIFQNRRDEFNKVEQFEYAKKASEYSNEIIKLENELRGYPNVIKLLNIFGIIAAVLALIAIIIKNN